MVKKRIIQSRNFAQDKATWGNVWYGGQDD